MSRFGMIILLFTMFIAGCSSDSDHSVEPRNNYIVGDTIRVAEGEKFEIILNACISSCGLGWEFIKPLSYKRVFLMDYSIENLGPMEGSPQEQKWTYITKSKGVTYGMLYYWRWNSEDTEPEKVKHIVLIIN